MTRLVRRIVPDRKGDAPTPSRHLALHDEEKGPITASGPEQDHVLDYLEVGERVAAVLESAQRTAEDILAQARGEAERFLVETEDQATASVIEAARKAEEIRRETEQLRAEAERYSTATREAADAYAAEKRGGAEEAAAKAISEAEERVTRVAAIVAEAGRFEDRLQNLATVFRGMTGQLDDLLAKKQERMEDELPTDETLQESLEEPIKDFRADAGTSSFDLTPEERAEH
jgi:hypothetical protein